LPIIADQYHGTKINLPIVKGKGKNKVEITMNITIDENTKQLFTESVFLREFNLSMAKLYKVNVANPSLQIPRIVIFRHLYDDFSGQELIDSMDQIVKTVQFVFAFIGKYAKGKTDLKTSENITQGTG